jgi:glutathione S-transferase
MKLYYSPLSSYSQKTLTAFYEKNVPVTLEMVDLTTAEGRAAYKEVYPLGKVPFLVLDDGWPIPESSTIIEYLDTHFATGNRLIPEDKDLARRTRLFDRYFDLYVNDGFQKIFFDARRPDGQKDAMGVARARETLDVVYKFYDGHFAKNTWAVGDTFTMADCAAAPALMGARMVHPFDKHPQLTAYFGRLTERPSFARVVEEVKPHFAKLMG